MRPDGLSELGWGFIKSLLVPNPRKRLDAVEALRHDWMTFAGQSAGNRGTAGLITVTDTDAPERSISPSLNLQDRSLRTGSQTVPKPIGR